MAKNKKTIFEGAATALVTPLTENGIDYEAFGRLIDWQIEGGIDALVVCGTTGEASTLTDDEHRDAIAYAVKRAAGRVPVIAGTGSNDTGYALDLTRCACEAGADAMLVVTPYYNKATQKGLVRMFETLADASDKPIILYNVPGRTGVNIEPSTYLALADHPNISAIKEANGNISKIVETAALVGDKLDIYSGNDDQIVPIMSVGGKGVISVLSNLIPGETSEICKSFMRGDIKKSMDMQAKYLSLINALFCEVNPIPVKAAMSAMGFCENYLRLPLTTMEDAHMENMLSIMRSHGII
ncbi:MAG: 4-hydroxy-tetrahydrodipicolinate synthase [Ruminococcaceae bacterium]|nr:4-hydroxy-tetrahydrodipicolinate synthase [Oscillospiraceae bacterium]